MLYDSSSRVSHPSDDSGRMGTEKKIWEMVSWAKNEKTIRKTAACFPPLLELNYARRSRLLLVLKLFNRSF